MKNQPVGLFTSIEEIRVLLPNPSRKEWLTEVICTNSAGLRGKLLLSSVDRYANIWALTHDIEKMELTDLFDGITKYEFGRFHLSIKSGEYTDEQWFLDAKFIEI